MFHLPQEIIRNIYEFDPTYREEYNKSVKILYDELPPYYIMEITLVDIPILNIPPTTIYKHIYFCPLRRIYFQCSVSLTPSTFYFSILKKHK